MNEERDITTNTVGNTATTVTMENDTNRDSNTHTVNTRDNHTSSNTPDTPPPKLSGNISVLKEAFPDVDIEVIEVILETQQNNVDSAFEILLGMSDPTYRPVVPVDTPAENIPVMPPRPNSGTGRHSPPSMSTVEEQLRIDEELAMELAIQEEMRIERQRQQRQQRQQQKPTVPQKQDRNSSDDDLLFNFQEELPIIKEKMKEAGNAAKKKVLDFYNQLKSSTKNNNTSSDNMNSSGSIPSTNAHYRGLPSDEGDDLLTNDISALHLSDRDVYARTEENIRRRDDTIHVNPPVKKETQPVHTSTTEAQLKADEDFARQLIQQEEIEDIRRRSIRSHSRTNSENNAATPPQMPPRKTAMISSNPLLEYEGDSEYQDVRLTVPSSDNNSTNTKNTSNNSNNNGIPYVIGDDDSDCDDLVDIEEELEDSHVDEPDKSPHASTAVSKPDTKDTAPNHRQ
ncbi:hypothetical protein BDB01DRAFT_851284 [Pilobolus umbonatus]|nr:hypothetical protein BDB01DRAFT_851284 [Pilobolus umbonatus]